MKQPSHLICLCGQETKETYYAKNVSLYSCQGHFRSWKNVRYTDPHHFEYYFNEWVLSCSENEPHLLISFHNQFEMEKDLKIRSYPVADEMPLPKLDFSQIKSLNQLKQKINTLLNFS